MDGENNWYNINPSGISSSVEYLLSKQRGRVRFPYPAQNFFKMKKLKLSIVLIFILILYKFNADF